MAQYRKRKGKDAWYWCSNCTNYPDSDYETSPSTGELCNQCREKQANGICN